MFEIQWRRRTPFIQQSETGECALACLAMIANYHGLKIDLGTLRQRFSLSLRGATLLQVMRAAEGLDFNTRPLRTGIDELAHLSLPAILHWDLNHFVVLTEVKQGLRGTRYAINDPARGALLLSKEELSTHFTGVALELLKAETFQPKIVRNQLKISQLWSSMSGLWPTARQVIFLSLVLQLVALATPFYTQLAVDNVFPSMDRDLLKMLAIGFAGLAIVNFLTGWLRSLILVTLGNTLSYQIIVNLFRHLVRLPLPWFEKRHIGDIISRFGSTKPITDLLSQGMIAAFIDGVMAIATLSLMIIYSGLLAAIAVAALALYVFVRLVFLQTIRLNNLSVITANARENSAFIETMRGIAAIKAFGQEGNRQRLWQRTKVDAVNAQVKLGRLSAGLDAANQLIMALERVLFVYIAIGMALDGRMTVGMIFAFQAYKDQFIGAGTRLVEQAINLNILQMHLTRIADIALSKPEQETHRSAIEIAQSDSPLIELRNVRFSYAPGEPEILRNVNLTVQAGQSLVLVGPSGGGKTTLLKIVMGLFPPIYGEVLINGIPLNAYGINRWRREIGLLAQDDSLFAGSIADNICFFDPEPDMARIIEVAHLACVAREIEKMPMQYDTLVGDMGSTLSGGQRQRILLARALYGRPRVLFTDEGTAHLDPENEINVIQALDGLDITHVAVAHRGRATAAAQRILFVGNGQVSEVRPQAPEIPAQTSSGD